MLRLETFGGLSLRGDDGSTPVTQRRRLALLALLAAAGDRGLSREKIAACLWPEASLDATRRSLDQLVYGVRREAGDTVVLGANPIRLDPTLIESDIALFERALANNSLESAVALYRGPFLDGFFLANAPDFERWVESERTRLAERFGGAVTRLAEDATARGDRIAAVGWWRRLAAHDPLGAPAALGLMHALAEAGDRGAALKHAKMYERLVMQELEVPPDPAVTKFADELRSQGDATGTAAEASRSRAVARLQDGPPSTTSAPDSSEVSSIAPVAARPATRQLVATLAGGVVLMMAAAWGLWKWRSEATLSDANGKKILVAPFRVVSADSSLREFGEGAADLLAAEFTGEGGPLAVDSRTAINAWIRLRSSSREPTADDARRIARLVGADRALVGELIQLPGGQLRLTGRLLRTSDSTVQVLPTVTGPNDSLTTLLDEFAGKVLAVEAGVAEPRVGSAATRSLPALRAYLAGRAERRRGRDQEALAHFARALELDSTFALAALDLVSTTGWLLRWVVTTPFDSAPQVVALLPGSNPARSSGDATRFDRALQLAWRNRARLSARDQNLLVALRGERYPQPSYATEVLASLERALRTAPDRAETHYAIGHLLLHQGPAIGLTDSRQRARASFQRALALDSSYADPLAGLLELAAFDRDSAGLRRLGGLYLERDSLSPMADYVRWRVATGTGDATELQNLRSRFASLSTQTLERIQTTSQVAGVAIQDADRAMDAIVRRATDPYERWIALFNASMLALNRGRPREALRLLRLKRELERTDDALWHNACLDETFGDGYPLSATDALRGLSVAGPGGRRSPGFSVSLCRLASGDTMGADAAIARLKQAGDERFIILDALRASFTRRTDADSLRLRLDSMVLRGCCAGPKWIGLAAAGLHERAGDDVRALRAIRAGRWLFPPQYLSTYLRDEGRLAARTGDRQAAIRAYRHYLILRSNPEPELRAEVDRIRAELARLERGH